MIKWQSSLHWYCGVHFSLQKFIGRRFLLIINLHCPTFFFKIKGKTSSEEKENNQMNKNQNKETHPCAMVPCSALKTSQIRHQLHTWRLGHRTSQPWVGSAVVCGAVHGRCVLSLWAPSQPGVKYFYQKRTPAAKIPLSALRPSSYGILFSPPF